MTWITYGDDQAETWRVPTQDEVARRFAEREAGRVRYCHDARAWFVWDGVAWRRDRTGVVPFRIREVARESVTDPDGHVGGNAGGIGFVAGVERFARCDPALAVTAEAFDVDPLLLGTPDGAVALATGRRAPAEPTSGIDRTTGIVPAATADCPVWRGLLAETFDRATTDGVQRVLGAALTGTGTHPEIVFGAGAGIGRSLILATVLDVMGDYARTTSIASLTGTDTRRLGPERAGLAGVRLVVVDEGDGVGAGRRLDRLCAATATTTTRRQGAGADPVRGRTVLVLGDRPPPPDARRLRVIAFGPGPARVDRALEAALRAEAPAILRWMIDGCLAWQAGGLGPSLPVPTDAPETRDPVGRFLDDRCIHDDARSESAAALFSAWSTWAVTEGEAAGSRDAFAEAMARRGFRRDRNRTTRLYVGLGLRAGPDDTA